MRSSRRVDPGQPALPFDVPSPAPAEAARDPAPPSHPPRPRAGRGRFHHRVGSQALASLGWPAGTELLVEPVSRPRRGQVVLVRESGRLKIGVYDVELGRATLRSDTGSTWLGPTVEYVGVATLAGAPLDGMPP